MKKKKIIFVPLVFIFALVTIAKSQSPIPPDREQLLNGESAGLNLIAEENGFPSPQKIISLKDQLGLSKDQLKKINEMLTNLPVSLTVKGQDIVEAEEELNKLFASGNINEKTLRAKLERIGKLRSELRFSVLQIYLKTKQLLSVNQWDRLKEIMASEVR